MIGKLRGIVDTVGEDEAILEVGGVGYLVRCGSRTLARLKPGEEAVLHVETHVREDMIRLFGFWTEDERAWFARLQDIQGVGAKVALAILDVLTPSELMTAAAHEDEGAVARAHGVGKRLAQRVVSELNGKAPPATRSGVPASAGGIAIPAPVRRAGANGANGAHGPDPWRDAASALVNLGVGEAEARVAVAKAAAAVDEGASVDVLIKAALKEIGR